MNKENIGIVRKLLECCQNHKKIVAIYNSPNSGVKSIEMLTKKLVHNSGKLYLRALGLEYLQETDFLVSRIVDIRSIEDFDEDVPSAKELKVVYNLHFDKTIPELNENEKLLEAGKNDAVIQISGNNPFYITQRILEHGCNATVVEPEDFKKQHIELLSAMRERYQNGCNI